MQGAVGFLTLLYVETSFLLNSDLGATNRTMGRVADAESAVTDLQKSLLDSERDVCVCVCLPAMYGAGETVEPVHRVTLHQFISHDSRQPTVSAGAQVTKYITILQTTALFT